MRLYENRDVFVGVMAPGDQGSMAPDFLVDVRFPNADASIHSACNCGVLRALFNRHARDHKFRRVLVISERNYGKA